MIDKTTTVSKTKLQKEEHQCATQSGSRPRAAPSRADAASWRTWQRPHRTHDPESIVRIVGRSDRRKSIAPMTGLFDHKGVLGWPAGPLSCTRRLPSN